MTNAPWLDEPDLLEFRHLGAWCFIRRNTEPGLGFLCGYVYVPAAHPWAAAASWSDDLLQEISVHGGVTYCESRAPVARSLAREGKWIGFDCAHAGDLVPFLRDASREYETYRTIDYVRSACESLAEQAVSAAPALFQNNMHDEFHTHMTMMAGAVLSGVAASGLPIGVAACDWSDGHVSWFCDSDAWWLLQGEKPKAKITCPTCLVLFDECLIAGVTHG